MHYRLGLGLILALAAAAGLQPRIANACDYAPGVWGSIPEDGSKLPANAAVFLRGADLSLTDGTVMVDDAIAILEVIPELSGTGTFGDLALRIIPEPQPGQTVTFEGSFCPPEYLCEPISLKFEVVEPDHEAPSPVVDLGFDVLEHGFEYGDDCGGPTGDISYYLSFDEGAPNDEPVRLLHEVEVHRAGIEDGDPVRRLSIYSDDDEGARTLRVLLDRAMDLDGADAPEAFCFTVITRDASNNVSAEIHTACLPCHHRVDPNIDYGYQPPEWTDDDIYGAGVCAEGGTGGGGTGGGGDDGGTDGGGDDGGTGGGGGGTGGTGAGADDDGTRGCACGAAGAGPGWLLGVMLAGMFRRRRGHGHV